MAGYESPVIAFMYVDGKLYFGSNHLAIVDLYFNDSVWPPDGLSGWIWHNDDGTMEAEFYSDNYPQQEDADFNDVFQKLKKRFPELTTMSYGPDKELWNELHAEDAFEPKKPEDPFKISFKWSKEAGLEIPFED